MRGERLFAPWFDLVDAPAAMRAFVLSELGLPTRHWHGLVHHALMMRMVTRADHAAAGTRRLVLATLFHDIVYDATRSDNEESSAAVLREWVKAEDADAVAGMIVATRQHDLHTDPVTRTLLEADLAVLWTASRQLYAFYARGVRAEYGHVPDDAYRAGRSAVLGQLRDQLMPYLDQARRCCLARNLDGEIARLASAG